MIKFEKYRKQLDTCCTKGNLWRKWENKEEIIKQLLEIPTIIAYILLACHAFMIEVSGN